LQPGDLVGGDVHEFQSYVLVNGVVRDALSWSVDRDLVGDLPEQVVSAAGLNQATGSIEWGTRDDVTGEVHPWDPSSGWIPMVGDRVQIYVTDGVTSWPQFVGVIDDATGAVGEYGVASKIVDNIDKFSVRMNLPALLDAMPPLDTGVPRRMRLSPRFYLATAMRRAGYYLTPADEDGCVMSMPGIGSMWPLIGTLVRSRRTTAPGASPLGGGTFMQDATADYQPSVARAANVSTSITLCIPSDMAGVVAVTCSYGSASLALRVGGGNVSARVNGAVTISADRSGATIVQVLMRNGQIRLRSNTGLDHSAAASTGSGSTLMSNIQIYADGEGKFSGVQVAHPSVGREFSALGFTPTAVIGTGAFHEALAAGRATEDMTAKELLDEIGQALLIPFWIDEAGIARAVASDVLRSRPPVRTLTTLDDIKNLSWRRDLLGARTRVSANYEAATVNRRADYSLEVWASNEATVLGSNETHDTLIETPSDEAWIMVNEGLTVPGVSSLSAANKGIGTLAGGLYTDGVNEEWAVLPADVLTVALTRIKQGVWRVRHTTKTLAAGKQVELRTWSSTFSGRTELWPYWWDKELPRLRAKALVKFVDKTFGPVTAGSVGPELTHDCKSWATGNLETNETTVIENIVNFIAAHVTNPEPIIEGLDIVYDPRLQLGDVVTVSSPSLLGVEFRCLIVGVSLGADGAYSQSLKVRIISVTQTGITYQQFADAWGHSASYETFNTAWSALSTYQEFNTNPLEGA